VEHRFALLRRWSQTAERDSSSSNRQWPTSSSRCVSGQSHHSGQKHGSCSRSDRRLPRCASLPTPGIKSKTLPTPSKAVRKPALGQPARCPDHSKYASYMNVWAPGTLPQTVRDLVDMTDAEAQGAMKKSLEIDALADLSFKLRNRSTSSCRRASRKAAILEAQKCAWLLRAKPIPSRRWPNWCAALHRTCKSGGANEISRTHATTPPFERRSVAQQVSA